MSTSSMSCHVHLRNGTIYLPTIGKMDEGFYREVEPVVVVSASDFEEIRRALQTIIARGNPMVPMLRRSEIPPPVILKYAGVKRWSEFERGLTFWTIKQYDGAFQIEGQAKQSDGGWRTDPERKIVFSPNATADEVTDRMITILQDAAKKPQDGKAQKNP